MKPALLAHAERDSFWIDLLASLFGATLGGLTYRFVGGEPPGPAELASRVPADRRGETGERV